MNPHYQFLYLVFTHQPCTRFHLENIERGRFKNQIEECIRQEYIEALDKNQNGDDLYYITETGKKIIDNPKEEQS